LDKTEIIAFTDMPFITLGDELFEKGPMRQVTLLSYDGYKYVTVRLENDTKAQIRPKYLYRVKMCSRPITQDMLNLLPRVV
jgi:hypothetical protein